MYYRKKRIQDISFLSETTLAEKISGRFDVNEKPTSGQINRFAISVVLGLFLALGWCSQGHTNPVVNLYNEMDNGAGTDWSCSKCGSSNKQWEMSCSTCGEWR